MCHCIKATRVMQGFGATLIERGIAHDPSGGAKLHIDPEGVRASIRALIGNRVLIVWDAFLAAILVEDVLVAQGCVVIGPVARVADALAAAESAAIEVAMLAVNVAGEPVFPVTLTLKARISSMVGLTVLPSSCATGMLLMMETPTSPWARRAR